MRTKLYRKPAADVDGIIFGDALPSGCAEHPLFTYARCATCYQIVLLQMDGVDAALYDGDGEFLRRSCKSYRVVE